MFFSSTVTLYPATSKNGFGDITYGTPRVPKCNFDKIEKIISGPGNSQFLTCAWVQFAPGEVIGKEDKIILPDGTTSPIISLNRPERFGIEICVEVWLGEVLSGGMQ